MHTLFPELEPFAQCMLDTGNGHNIYMEQCGNPDGIAVIFLHGGPGSGSNPNHRRYFDPGKYRIVIFDQRGCNRATPRGCTEKNTTADLMQDLERIRARLQIDKWLVFGGSWGATLGLLYAEQFPQRVTGLILRGTFLARQMDVQWFSQEGANRVFPDYWEQFIKDIPLNERQDLVAAYHKRLSDKDVHIRQKYARAWSDWATRVVTYNLAEQKQEQEQEDMQVLVDQVSIETHYAVNRYFIEENQILNEIAQIPDVPVIIIHGRRDMTCTLEASWSLHQALPESEFVIVPDAGHLAGEPALTDALITATNKMAALLQ